jgi:hypothetical protein
MVTADKGLLLGSLTETVEDSRAMNAVIDGHIPLLFYCLHLSTPGIWLGCPVCTSRIIEVVP